MSQNSLTLPTTGTVSGLQMTQNMNNALDTLNTLASGAAAPASPEAGQLWHDTANNLLKIRSLDNTAWIAFLQINEAAYAALPDFTSQVTGFVNRVINGAMDIDQVNEGASYAIPVNNTQTYTLDQWFTYCATTGSPSGVTIQRVADAPPGFVNSLKVTVGTGAGSVGVNDYFYLSQPIEANNLSDFNYGGASAVPASLSFWVKSSVTGAFAASLQNAASNRSIVYKFTVASAGVWQLVTLPNIPGDQAGTWATGNNAMLEVIITLAAGSACQNSTLGAWLSADWLASTSQSNALLTTSGATFQVTGVMLNPGAFCLPFEKRAIQQELHLCERYYTKTFAPGNAVAQNAGFTSVFWFPQVATAGTVAFSPMWMFRTIMRSSPTVTLYNPVAANAQIRNNNTSSDFSSSGAPQIGVGGVLFDGTAPTGSAVGNSCAVHATANARM